MKHTPAIELEFSRPIAVDKIPAGGLTLTLEPKDAERLALAKRFDLVDLTLMKAEVVVRHASLTDGVSVTGTLTADVVQECGVTLEPLHSHIEEDIDAIFIKAEKPDEDAESLDLSLEEGDIELIENGFIDLGELLAQNLGISLDPYPRKADLPPVGNEYTEPPKSENPFAKLAEWKKKPKDNG